MTSFAPGERRVPRADRRGVPWRLAASGESATGRPGRPAAAAGSVAAQGIGEGAVAVNADLALLDHLVQGDGTLREREAAAGVDGELGIRLLSGAVEVAGLALVEADIKGALVEPYLYDT